MLRLYDCITGQHDLSLVFLAGTICLLAGFTAFSLVARAQALAGPSRAAWIGAAAVVAGGGVWATHFIAMLAYAAHLPVGYDLGLTLASVLIAVTVSAAGLTAAIVGRAPAVGGAVLGAGIAMMHYTGMAAIEAPADKEWESGYVAASLVVGVAFGGLAMTAADRGGRYGRAAAVGFFALAVCGLHFTGMSAFTLLPDLAVDMPERLAAPDWLAAMIAVITLAIVGIGLLGATVDERLARRSAEEAERLRRYVAELEATKQELEATGEQLQLALEAAAAGSQAKSQFLATMSHELRTPLNAVIGFSELLGKQVYGPLGDPRYERFAKTIAESGHHLLDLINDVLDVSRLDAGKVELHESDVDVGALVAESLRIVERQAATAAVGIAVDVQEGLPALHVDRRRMRQVLLNLLSNAVKFTPEGGTVTVSAAGGPDGLGLTVADTGIGMAAEDIPRALERFGQIDSRIARRYDGTGLGLPLSKRLVELHGGEISIDSTVGAGTTVTVTLPPERLRSRATAA